MPIPQKINNIPRENVYISKVKKLLYKNVSPEPAMASKPIGGAPPCVGTVCMFWEFTGAYGAAVGWTAGGGAV